MAVHHLVTSNDQLARDAGYTRQVYIDGAAEGGSFLINPTDDHDSKFMAWGIDWQDWAWVNGSNVLMEDEA